MTDPSSNDPENSSSNNPEEEAQDSNESQDSSESQDSGDSQDQESGSAEPEHESAPGSPKEYIDEIHSLQSQIRAWRIATIVIVLAIFTICVYMLINSVMSLFNEKGLENLKELVVKRATDSPASLWPQVEQAGTKFIKDAKPKLEEEVKALVDNKKDVFTKMIGDKLKGLVTDITDRTTNAFTKVLNEEMHKKLGTIAQIAGETNQFEGVETDFTRLAQDFNLDLVISSTNTTGNVVKKIFDPQFQELKQIRAKLDYIYDKEIGNNPDMTKRRVTLKMGLAMTQRIIKMLEKHERALIDIQGVEAIRERERQPQQPPESNATKE